MRLTVRVKPGSSRPGITVENDFVVVRVHERAIGGAANAACIRALAAALDIAPSRITLLRGARTRQKTFAIDGLDEAALRARIG